MSPGRPTQIKAEPGTVLKKTNHVLYFQKAGASRISNIILRCHKKCQKVSKKCPKKCKKVSQNKEMGEKRWWKKWSYNVVLLSSQTFSYSLGNFLSSILRRPPTIGSNSRTISFSQKLLRLCCSGYTWPPLLFNNPINWNNHLNGTFATNLCGNSALQLLY